MEWLVMLLFLAKSRVWDGLCGQLTFQGASEALWWEARPFEAPFVW